MFDKNSKLKIIYFLGFLFSLNIAFTSYINSSFLSVFSGENNISLIYVAGSMLSILMLFFTPNILQKIGSYKMLVYSSFLSAFSLFLLSIVHNKFSAIFVFIFYFSLNSLIVFVLDELVEIFSKNSNIGMIRGLYLSFSNLAWVIAQMISSKSFSRIPLSTIYSFSALIMLVLILFAFFGLKNLQEVRYDKTIAWQNFKNFFIKIELKRIYKINFLLQSFYVAMVVYTPVYLFAHLGFSWKEISFIFTIMLSAFVLIEYPLGRYSDKIGERKMLMLGFLIMSISTILLFFIKRHDVLVWAIMLFITRSGAAIIEVMSDVYLFKHIKKENDEFIAVYRNTSLIAYIFIPIVFLLIFNFLPSFNYIFVVLGAFMLYGVYLSSTINKADI